MAPAARRSSVVPPGAGTLPEHAYRLLVDGTAAPFVLVDRIGTVTYASGSLAGVLGWAPADLVGHNVVEYLRPDQIDLAIQAITEIDDVDREGDGIPMVFAVVRPEGGHTWVEIGAMPLLDHAGLDCIALRLRPWDAEHHLAEFLNALLADASLGEVLVSLSRSIAASVQAAGAAVHHGFDGEGFVGVTGSWPGAADLALDKGPWCDAAVEGTQRWLDEPGAPPEPAAANAWLVPIPGDGVAPAVLTIWRTLPGPPLLGHRHALDRLSGYVRLAMVRTAEHQRLQHLAGHDSLTGVANRGAFRDRLAAALAIGERDLAVAFCDLDDFKPVNDTYGHRVGDQVLVEVAARLRDTLRVGDELARIGGDEFTVLLRNVPDAVVAGQVADRLLGALERPFTVPGGEVRVGLSVGVAMAAPGSTAGDLLATADAALYACKRAGGRRSAVVG